MRRSLCLAAVVAIVGSGCREAAREFTEQQRLAVMDTVFQVHADLVSAAEQLDAERLLGFFAEDPGLIDDGAVVPYDALAKRVRGAFSKLDGQRIQWHPAKTSVLSRDVVVMTIGGRTTVLGPAGDTTWSRPVAWTEVWVRRDGEWKLLHAHQSHQPDESM